jgi:hypothetical protein
VSTPLSSSAFNILAKTSGFFCQTHFFARNKENEKMAIDLCKKKEKL